MGCRGVVSLRGVAAWGTVVVAPVRGGSLGVTAVAVGAGVLDEAWECEDGGRALAGGGYAEARPEGLDATTVLAVVKVVAAELGAVSGGFVVVAAEGVSAKCGRGVAVLFEMVDNVLVDV